MDAIAHFCFDLIFLSLVGNEEKHKILDEFDFGPDRTHCF